MPHPHDIEKIDPVKLVTLVIDMSQLLYAADVLLADVKWFLAGLGPNVLGVRELHGRVHAWRDEAGVEAARVIVTERRKALLAQEEAKQAGQAEEEEAANDQA